MRCFSVEVKPPAILEWVLAVHERAFQEAPWVGKCLASGYPWLGEECGHTFGDLTKATHPHPHTSPTPHLPCARHIWDKN